MRRVFAVALVVLGIVIGSLLPHPWGASPAQAGTVALDCIGSDFVFHNTTDAAVTAHYTAFRSDGTSIISAQSTALAHETRSVGVAEAVVYRIEIDKTAHVLGRDDTAGFSDCVKTK